MEKRKLYSSVQISPDNAGTHQDALRLLGEACSLYGAQSELARALGLKRLHFRGIMVGERRPSAEIAEAIEREVGIPASWWEMRRVRSYSVPKLDARPGPRQQIRQMLADRRASSPIPLEARLGWTRERLVALIDGTEEPTEAERRQLDERHQIPAHWWDF